MAKFRKKPVVIDAIRWTGDNFDEVIAFGLPVPLGIDEHDSLAIRTLDSTAYASIGDWIIKGVRGEFYPCNAEIFSDTYHPAEGDRPASASLQMDAGTLAALVAELPPDAHTVGDLLRCLDESAHAAEAADNWWNAANIRQTQASVLRFLNGKIADGTLDIPAAVAVTRRREAASAGG
jgi:hypothetical protein